MKGERVGGRREGEGERGNSKLEKFILRRYTLLIKGYI